MSRIQEVVAQVGRLPAVRGAVLLTPDGLIAATGGCDAAQAEVVAGLASYLMMTTNRSLGEGVLGACDRLTVHASNGKAVIVDVGDSFLAVLFDQFAEIGPAAAGIDDAAVALRGAARLG